MILRKWRQWLIFVILSVTLFSLPVAPVETLRSRVADRLASQWERLHLWYTAIQLASQTPASMDVAMTDGEEIHRLETENGILRRELETLRSMAIEGRHPPLLEGETAHPQFHIARVIFRPTTVWSDQLWINCGRESNSDPLTIVAKNSPVLVGNVLIGVIDAVYARCSRVKLIADPSLVTSVRVHRSGSEISHLRRHLETLLDHYDSVALHLENLEERHLVFDSLSKVSEAMMEKENQVYLLAKGEIHGGKKDDQFPGEIILDGSGFNCDFPDAFGPARDLRTGEPIGMESRVTSSLSKTSLVEPNDLLVTTGLDGRFPQGLRVAEVIEVLPLNEGDFAYSLRARSLIDNYDAIECVSILPPCEGLNLIDERIKLK